MLWIGPLHDTLCSSTHLYPCSGTLTLAARTIMQYPPFGLCTRQSRRFLELESFAARCFNFRRVPSHWSPTRVFGPSKYGTL